MYDSIVLTLILLAIIAMTNKLIDGINLILIELRKKK